MRNARKLSDVSARAAIRHSRSSRETSLPGGAPRHCSHALPPVPCVSRIAEDRLHLGVRPSRQCVSARADGAAVRSGCSEEDTQQGGNFRFRSLPPVRPVAGVKVTPCNRRRSPNWSDVLTAETMVVMVTECGGATPRGPTPYSSSGGWDPHGTFFGTSRSSLHRATCRRGTILVASSMAFPD